MATNLVIDADGHCNEPDVGLAKWLPKEHAHLAPNRVTDSSGYSHLMIEGRLAGRRRWGGGADRGAVFADHIERSRPGMTDATKRLPDMDEEGIDVAVIFRTSIALMVNGMADKPLAAAICHAVNRWLVEEYIAPDPKRLKGVGLDPRSRSARCGKRIGIPGPATRHRHRDAADQRLRHQPRPPYVRSGLRRRAGDRHAAFRAPADRARRPVRRVGRHGRGQRAHGEVQLRAHDLFSFRMYDRAHAHDRRGCIRSLPETKGWFHGGRLWLGPLLGGTN